MPWQCLCEVICLPIFWHFMTPILAVWDTPHDFCLQLISSYDPHLQEWDQVTELNQLEQFLRQPDAVMEPNIMEKLRQYVAKGGSPRDVVEMLTDSYLGTHSTSRCWATICTIKVSELYIMLECMIWNKILSRYSRNFDSHNFLRPFLALDMWTHTPKSACSNSKMNMNFALAL